MLFTYFWLPEKVCTKDYDEVSTELLKISRERDEWKNMCYKLNEEIYTSNPGTDVLPQKTGFHNQDTKPKDLFYNQDFDVSQFF